MERKIDIELFQKLVVEQSPSGGYHAVYRCGKIDGNLKLAAEINDGKHVTSIETRGEGGIFLCDPTPGYRIMQGNFEHVPTITIDERNALFDAARSFNQTPTKMPANPSVSSSTPPSDDGESVFEAYKSSGAVRELLLKFGWKYLCNENENERWQRPGKEGKGHSAHLDAEHGFYVFSSNAHPLENDRCYSPGQLYAALVHDGDLSAAAKDLLNQGCGTRLPRPVDNGHDTAPFYCSVADSEPVEPAETPRPAPADPIETNIPKHLLNVPGFIGEMVEYTKQISFCQQPEMRLAGAVAFMSLLVGRRVKDESGIRANLYIISISRTGTGKQSVFSAIRNIRDAFTEIDPSRLFYQTLAMENIESRQALLNYVIIL